MKKNICLVTLICTLILGLAVFAACNSIKTSDEVTYTVSYMDGQTVLQSGKVIKGASVGTAYTPTAPEGKTFGGWYSDAEFTSPVTGDTTVSADLTLFVKWVDKTFTVRFLDKDDTEIKSEVVIYGNAATAPDAPTVSGFTFASWDTAFDNVKSNLTVRAVYEISLATLSFAVGDDMFFSSSVAEGSPISPYAESALESVAPHVPAGFLFDRWQIDGTDIDADDVMPSTALTVTAKLKLADFGPIAVTTGNSFNFSSSLVIGLSASGIPAFTDEPITVTTEWFVDGVKQNTAQFVPVSIGEYVIKVKITLSSENCDDLSKTAYKTVVVQNGTFDSSAISASDVNVFYDATEHGITVSNLLSGDTVYYKTSASADWSATNPTFINAGEYNVYYKVSRPNYNDYVAPSSVTVKVQKATLSVNVKSESVYYGDALPTFTMKDIAGFLGTDTMSVVSGSAVFACGVEDSLSVGTSYIRFMSGLTADNYIFASVDGTITVLPRAVTITADDKTATYGSAAPEFSSTYALIGDDTITVTYTCDYAVGDGVGDYYIVPFAQNDNYNFTFVSGNLSVNAKEATITADDKTTAYGSAAPGFSFVADGIFGDDTVTVTYTCDYTVGDGVGDYDIVPFAQNDNYNFTFISGNLSVSKKAVTLNIVATCAYVGDDVAWSKPITSIDGLIAGDVASGTLATISGAEGNYSDENDFVWTTPLDVKNNGVSVLNNYVVTLNANVTIEVRSFATTENNVDVIYDKSAHSATVSTTALSDYTVTYGLTADVYDLATAPSFIDAGAYTVYYKVVDNLAEHSPATGSLSVKIAQKAATITADDKTISFTDAKPAFTATESGVISADSLVYTLDSTYAVGSPIGDYDVIVTVGTNKNYAVTATNGTLSVGKKSLTVTANNATIHYGDALPAFTSNAPEGSIVSFTCSYTVGDGTGSYAIIPSATNDSYEFSYVNGVLTVDKKEITVTANDKSIVYGDALPATFTSDAPDGVAVHFTCSYTAGNDCGEYAITPLCDEHANYTFNYANGTLSVNQKTINVVIDDKTVTYGDAIPAYSAQYTLLYDDTASFSFICEYTPTSDVGTYAITASSVEDGNYTFTYTAGTLSVSPKTVAVVWSGLDGTYVFNGTNQAASVTATYSIVKFNDSTEFINAGTYSLKAVPASGNYTLTNDTASVTMGKASATISDNTIQAYNYDGVAHGISGLSVLFNGVAISGDSYSLTYTNGNAFADAGTFRTDVNIVANNYKLSEAVPCYVKVRSVYDGSEYFTIEEALMQKTSGTLTLNAVTSFANSYNSCYGQTEFTLPSGLTLILASDDDTSTTIGKPTYGAGSASYVDNNAAQISSKLTIPSSISLSVNGKILVQGLLGYAGQKVQGHTSGKHGQIINDGTITLNSGSTLDLRGFVKGNGQVNMSSGSTVYSPFVVRDFRGGTNTVTVYRKGSIAPFSQYEMPNIQCEYKLYYGAIYKGYVDLYANSSHNSDVVTIIGTSDGIIKLSAGASVTKSYDRANEKTSLTLVGNVNMGALSLTVNGISVSMAEVQFPIPWTYDVYVGDGVSATTLTASYDYKIMTGANVVVAKNATMNLSGSVIVYESFTDTAFGGSIYPDKPAAKLTVNGTLNVTGTFGGKIYSDTDDAVVTIGSSTTLSATSVEGNSGSTSSLQALFGGGTFVTVATITETAAFVNADKTTLAAQTGSTYVYTNGTWIKQ